MARPAATSSRVLMRSPSVLARFTLALRTRRAGQPRRRQRRSGARDPRAASEPSSPHARRRRRSAGSARFDPRWRSARRTACAGDGGTTVRRRHRRDRRLHDVDPGSYFGELAPMFGLRRSAPTVRRRYSARSAPMRPVTSTSPTWIEPEVGVRIDASIDSGVVLPQPLAPSSNARSPVARSRSPPPHAQHMAASAAPRRRASNGAIRVAGSRPRRDPWRCVPRPQPL